MTNKIRIAVVDDHPLFRGGVIHTLSTQDDMLVIGEGATAADAVRLARHVSPDVLLLDLNLEGDAMKAIETITRDAPSVNVIMLTVVDDEERVTAAIRLGARGYILKGISGVDLAETVRIVSRRELYVSPCLAAQMLGRLRTTSERKDVEVDRFSSLTERENQILALLSQALSNKEIAFRIALTEKTVKHYLTSILKKLRVKNRVEAALLASHRQVEPAGYRYGGVALFSKAYS